MEMTLPALIHYTHTLALTSEHRSEQSGDDTASIDTLHTHTLALTSEHRSEQSGDDTASIDTLHTHTGPYF